MASLISPNVSVLCISLISFTIFQGISGATFTLINRCPYTIWPGILSNAGSPALDSTGFELPSGGSRFFQAPTSWSGRFWGRTGCTFDPETRQGSCLTGDCSTNRIECNGQNAMPPATLAEFTIGSGTAQDFYDVSLVDGYNLPMIVEPIGGSGTCLATGCLAGINKQCPAELQVGSGEACKSACNAFGSPEYCCSGAYASPDACKPSVYSEIFKAACPRAYSYAYDDATSTFTCAEADYVITFCPSLASRKSASASSTTAVTSTTNGNDGSEATAATSSGELPMADKDNSSWLFNLFNGASSSRTVSSSAWTFTWIASTISLLLLSLSLLDV